MHLRRLWLTDFRSYPSVELELPEGLCAVVGRNGTGKSNLLEAVGYLGMTRSFRGAPDQAMVRNDADRAVIRGDFDRDGREILVEAEISLSGRNRLMVNRQRVTRSGDLRVDVGVTVFSPDDLEILKGGPSARRDLLDDLLVSIHVRNQAVRSDWERTLRQRNALLKQMRGRPDSSALVTLDVWNEKAAAAGDALADLRYAVVADLQPLVLAAYVDVATGTGSTTTAMVELSYDCSWRHQGLRAALETTRDDEIRRGVTLVGPHRDELSIRLDGMPSRTHASQGEQRSLALALRLATHRLAMERTGTTPILLLDDVFSELDPQRSAALLAALPDGQAFLSSAAELPDGVDPACVLTVEPGRVSGTGSLGSWAWNRCRRIARRSGRCRPSSIDSTAAWASPGRIRCGSSRTGGRP